jgi:type IV secretion system protein VirB10
MKFTKLFLLVGALATPVASTHAQEINLTATPSEPGKAALRNPQPFELSSGTYIELLLLIADPLMVTAQVSHDVYDVFGNVTIPMGSRLIGKQIRQVNDRHEVRWTDIQVPAAAGTLRLNHYFQGTMPDGSAGLVNFKTGARAGAMVIEPIIFPH